MKKTIFTALAVFASTITMTTSCSCEQNPLLKEWDAPFGIAPFSEIKTEHYKPAIIEAMKMHAAEIDAIINNPEAPTFENTLVAIDNAGERFGEVFAVFQNETSINSNPELMALEMELTPIVIAHFNEISMNEKLFERVKAVYEQREELGLDQQQMRLLTESYKGYERAGATLPAELKEELKAINARISELELAFEQAVLLETSKFMLLIEDPADLAGLPQGLIDAAAAKATAAGHEGKWAFGLDNASVMPFLQYADSHELRTKMFDAYISRANHDDAQDNKANVAEQLRLRARKAEILGYDGFAEYVLAERMAKTPENVYNLLNSIWTPALKAAKAELKDMTDYARRNGYKEPLTGADWRYYFEKVKAEKFNLSDEEIRPYLTYANVKEGIFYMANKLYGITFTPLAGVPVPHPEAEAFECKDADGSHLGVIFMDMFERPGAKRGGAWCSGYREQSYKDGERHAPIVTIVGNFTRGVGDAPALLTSDETKTFFHEFGHALQALLQDVKYKGIANMTRDFVELPSQVCEHWAFAPEVLKVYAKHYQTGEVIPDALIAKMDRAGKYGQGFATTELTAASLLDMDFFALDEIPADFNASEFEAEVLGERGLISQIPPRYRATYFRHVFGGGYTVGYYSYQWSEVLDADAFYAFEETGDIFNQEVARAFREEILEKGGSDDADVLYRNFRGKEAEPKHLLKNRGLL